MSILIIPACLGLLIKMYILYSVYGNSKRAPVFTTMLAIFACHNVCEVIAYIQYFQGSPAIWLVRSYYAISVIAMLYMSFYAMQVSQVLTNKKVVSGLTIGAIMVSLLILLSGAVITGSKPMGYTLTAIHGEMYWLFRVSVLGCMSLILFILIRGYQQAQSDLRQIQCLYTLLSMLPLILSGPTVLLLQYIGWQINSSIILPIASTFYLVMIALSENGHKLTDIRAYLPFSQERKTTRRLMRFYSDYSTGNRSYKEVQNDCERALILYSLEKSNYNVSKAAEMMQTKRTTLYSMCNRLNIPTSLSSTD